MGDPQIRPNEAIDFKGIDLADIDLEMDDRAPRTKREKSSINRPLRAFLLLLGIALVMWLPSTHFYKTSNYSTALFFGVCVFGLVITFAGGRFMWAWMEEAAERWAAEASPSSPKPPRVIQPLERWLTLLAALGLGAITLFAFPESTSYSDGSWMFKALGGATAAALGGRWLFIQAGRQTTKPSRGLPRLPSWFKWVNLTLLVIGAAVVLLSDLFFNSRQAEGYLSALGFILGIGGAIWLARRFDELETRFKNDGAQRSRKPPEA